MYGNDRMRANLALPGMAAGKLLFELQVEQHHHDETYHREIARLPMHQRLNHMALHFAKYAGKIAAARNASVSLPVFVDTLIIALSTANILNIELWDFVEPDKREFPGLLAFGRSLALQMRTELDDHASPLREMAIATGRMAAACEKIDHLEEVPYRSEISQSIARLSVLALGFIASQGVDPAYAVRDRLGKVKERLRLHGRV